MQSGEEDPGQKCIMKVFIVLEYEGPDLSQSGTFLSGRSRGSSSRWRDYTASEASSSSARRGFEFRGSSSEGISHPVSRQKDHFQYYDLQHGPSSLRQQGQEPRPGSAWQGGRHHHLRTTQDLREGVLDSTLDGRSELESRWLSQCMRSNSAHDGAQASSSSNKSDTLATFQQEEIDDLNSFVQLPESSASPRCSACAREMVDLRFVCMACGPLKNRAASSGADEQADSRQHADKDGEMPDEEVDEVVYSGYEICEACLEVQGSQHAHSSELPSKHVFLEAHRSLDSRAWRVVGAIASSSKRSRRACAYILLLLLEYAEAPACNMCGAGPLSLQAYRCKLPARQLTSLHCWLT